jgi:hypothetical protein
VSEQSEVRATPQVPPAPNPPAALPPAEPTSAGDPYAAAVGRVDITGIVPENVHVDPLITEGHVGYEESGESEIIPAQRLAEQPSAPDKGKNE